MDGKTELAGLVGWPVSHSRSPLMHQYWCKKYNVNAAYVPLAVKPGQVEMALRGLAASGFKGVNVTIPHKEAAYTICDELTPTALRAGAANTLKFVNGRIIGDCTDGTGFCENVLAHGGSIEGTVIILGAGGAARAIIAALLDKGCKVLIANRSVDRAKALVKALKGGDVIGWDEWPARLSEANLLINGTSLGMHGAPSLDWQKAMALAPAHLCVADIVYTPRETPFIKAAQEKGLKTVDGLGMLIYQAIEGFHLWFGVKPELDDELIERLNADLNKQSDH
ncbi:shikimate dehydrogenase [Aristophania vespae]|uniref:shikimate dehydrogenase n=1 Tax=Aristophania vespae TaxID=2697033 RepID=UPI0023513A55|nr:shikimate dehydrogenase [Aristophania vespae]UMM63333.1 Shikimate dehydrogenase (NADP(+)) [Aristophania vespae]